MASSAHSSAPMAHMSMSITGHLVPRKPVVLPIGMACTVPVRRSGAPGIGCTGASCGPRGTTLSRIPCHAHAPVERVLLQAYCCNRYRSRPPGRAAAPAQVSVRWPEEVAINTPAPARPGNRHFHVPIWRRCREAVADINEGGEWPPRTPSAANPPQDYDALLADQLPSHS